jgi:predicted RND superfamily exporter protein
MTNCRQESTGNPLINNDLNTLKRFRLVIIVIIIIITILRLRFAIFHIFLCFASLLQCALSGIWGYSALGKGKGVPVPFLN